MTSALGGASRTVKVRFTGDEADLKRSADASERALDGVSNSISKMNQVAVGASLAVLGLGAIIIGHTFADLQNIERLNAQTTQSIKTMNATWTNTTAITGYSQKLEKLTGIEAETIQEAQNLLLTFGNIRNEVGAGNDIFNQATSIVTDMSVVFGQDASAAAIQLGKALNDPLKGIAALSKVGVSFTEDQKKLIKQLVESGDVMGAQKVILAELTREVGGAAEAYGETSAGKVAKFKNELGDLSEGLVVSLLPALEGAIDKGRGFTQWLTEHEGFTKNAVLTLGTLSVAVLTVNAAVSTYKTVVDAAKIATELWTVASIALDVALSGGWIAALGPLALALGLIVLGLGLITKGMEGLGVTWGDVWDWIVDKADTAWDWLWERGSDFWKWLTETVPNSITSAFSSIGARIANPFIGAFNWIAGQWNRTVGALSANIPGVGNVSVPKISFAQYMKYGGPARAGMPYVIGDGSGPELFVPSQNGTIVSNPQDGGGWGGDTYVSVQVGNESIAAVARAERVDADKRTRSWVLAAQGGRA